MRAEELASSGDFEREHWIYVIKSSKKVQETNFLSELIAQKEEFRPNTRELTSFRSRGLIGQAVCITQLVSVNIPNQC